MRKGIVMHQEELRAHCTSVRSNKNYEEVIQYLIAVKVLLVGTWRSV